MCLILKSGALFYSPDQQLDYNRNVNSSPAILTDASKALDTVDCHAVKLAKQRSVRLQFIHTVVIF